MALFQVQYEERLKAYSRIVAKAWGDEAFKQRLLADPKATLQAVGVPVPAGAEAGRAFHRGVERHGARQRRLLRHLL